MPIHVTKVKEERRTVVATYGEEKATVEYSRNALSTRDWREIRQRAANEVAETAEDEFAVAVLSRILVKWDVMLDEKKAVPITKEALDELPPALLNAIIRAITADMFPSPEASAAGSESSF
jgi:hypothetical protein